MSDISSAERRRAAQRNQALPGGRFPIRNCEDARNAVRAVGRVRPNTEEARSAVRRFIIRRVRSLGGCNDAIPDNWNADGTLKG